MALGLGSLAFVYGLLRSPIGLALTAIRDNETASVSLGVRIERVKFYVYVLVAGLTGMVGGLFALQKIRISPDAAFSVNDWTAFVIFIVVIGGIGTIEGPIIGAFVYFLLREFLSDLGSIYLANSRDAGDRCHAGGAEGPLGICQEPFSAQSVPTGYRVIGTD